jgi:hypothetical protein
MRSIPNFHIQSKTKIFKVSLEEHVYFQNLSSSTTNKYNLQVHNLSLSYPTAFKTYRLSIRITLQKLSQVYLIWILVHKCKKT